MTTDLYRSIVFTSDTAYAYHQVIYNEDNIPVDYIFLDVNPAFERLTGLLASDIIDKKVTNVLHGIDRSSFNWISTYADIAQKGGTFEFKQYSEPLKKAYSIKVFSDKKHHFVTIFDSIGHMEKHLCPIIDGFSLGYLVIDQEGYIFQINTAFKKMLGCSGDEVIGRQLDHLMEPLSAAAFKNDLLSGNNDNTLRYELIRTDGTTLMASFDSGIHRDPSGNIVRMHYIVKDVTAEVREAELLKKSVEKLDFTLHSIACALVTCDISGRIEAMNELAEKLCDCSEKEALLKPAVDYLKFVNEKNISFEEDPLALAIKSKSTIWLPEGACLMTRSGHTVPISGNVALIRNRRDEVKGYMLMFQDDTEKRERQEMFKRYLNIAGVIILALDIRGNVTLINEKGCSVLGYKKEDILGKNWFEQGLVPGLAGETFKKIFHDSTSTGQNYFGRYENPVICSDGSKKLISWQNEFIYDGNGQVTGILSSGEDITNERKHEIRLKESEEKFRRAIELAPVPIMLHAEDGEVITINRSWTRITGYTADEIPRIGSWTQKAYGINHEKVSSFISELFNYDESHHNGQFEIKIKGGKKVAWDFYSAYIGNTSDGRKILMSLATDMTGMKIYEQEYEMIIRTAMDGFFIADTKGRILDANLSYCHLTDYTKEELLSMSIADLDANESITDVLTRILTIIKNGTQRFETKHIRKDGSFIALENSVSYSSETDKLYVFVHDISDRKQREESILYLSYHDKLTGLYNYAFFSEERNRLDKDRQFPLSIIMGDLNGLKLVNDTFGHSKGDEYINAVAMIIKNTCRDEDIIARVGGDEFCILLPRTDHATAEKISHRIEDACLNYNNKDDKNLPHMSIALGHATKTHHSQSLDTTIADAESSMYRKKLLSKNSMASSLISSIKTTMYEKCHETEEHAERLSILSKQIGKVLDLDDEDLNRLELISLLHDIGKMSVGEHVLNKKEPLTKKDWDTIRNHPEAGYRIAMAVPELMPVAECILCHHERWDRNGYPQGLDGKSIPLLARIVAVVDAYDSMTNNRPYRKAMSKESAIKELSNNAGKQFDPAIVEIFSKIMFGDGK